VPQLCRLIHELGRQDYRLALYEEAGVSRLDSPRDSAKAVLPPFDPWAYVSSADLARDTLALAAHLPPDLDAVAAVARSGLAPGALVAGLLHLPLHVVSRPRGLLDPGHGFRLNGHPRPDPRRVLLIDDTAATGGEMVAAFGAVRGAWPGAEVIRAVAYCHPRALPAVDLCGRVYPGEHYLEWNWANAGHGTECGFDFDGILCAECPAEDNDDGPRYARFLAEVRPLHLPRRTPARLIATGRHAKYRAATEAWLARHGVRVRELRMREWEYDPARPWVDQVARWKADRALEAGVPMFAESEPEQARLIHGWTGIPVLCPPLGLVLPPDRDLHAKAVRRMGKARVPLGSKPPG
jgi:hypoxanthine phosphoribosyltransferase